MPVNLFLLMGESNTRKSSTVRSLTGIGKLRRCNIELADGTIREIFAMIQALQEKGVDPDVFINLVKENNCSNVLAPLRIFAARGCPDGEKYIERFLLEGWQINPIIVLGTDSLPYQLSPEIVTKFIENPIRPNSQNAKEIKDVWGWA